MLEKHMTPFIDHEMKIMAPGFLFIHSQVLIVCLLLLGIFLCAGDLAVNTIVKNLFRESKFQVSELQQILESGKCCEKIRRNEK